jgi:thioredoxin 1
MGILEKIFGPAKKKVLPTSLNDDNFAQEILQHRGIALVDVWSDGCPPCRQLEPVILALASDYADRVKVGELRIATGMRAAGTFQVRGTPTVLYFRDGTLVDRVVGFRGSLYHREILDELLAASPPPVEGVVESQ